MTSHLAFLLVRLLALLGVLAVSKVASPLGPYGISFFVLLGEVLLGYAWGRAEADITVCKPKTPDPFRLCVRMVVLSAVESIAAIQMAGPLAPALVAWRVLFSYLPFTLAEVFTFRAVCKPRKKR